MFKSDFPFTKKAIYLDTAGAALKPQVVIDSIVDFYSNYSINPHSGDSSLARELAAKIDEARKNIAYLVDADPSEVIFTSGTTESLNGFAQMVDFLKPGDEIVLSSYNHLSNMTPWMDLAKRSGAIIKLAEDVRDEINDKTKIVSIAQKGNSLYKVIDMDELFELVSSKGAILVNDAAQSILSGSTTLENSDVIAFSGNKLYGPTGIGVLIVKKELLQLLKPFKTGGGIVTQLNSNNTFYDTKDSYVRFEAGTPNTAGIVGLGEAVKYFVKNRDKFSEIEKKVSNYAYIELSKIEGIKILSCKGDKNLIFYIENTASQDVVSYLGNKNIISRAGRFCAYGVEKIVNRKDLIRFSFGPHNSKEEIDKVVEIIKNAGDFIDYV